MYINIKKAFPLFSSTSYYNTLETSLRDNDTVCGRVTSIARCPTYMQASKTPQSLQEASMDTRDYWVGIDNGEAPLVIGCDDRTAIHFSNSELNPSLRCGSRPTHGRQGTPGTPNPSIVEDANWYALRKNPSAARQGYRFGGGDRVHFELANFVGSNRISRLHFRVLLTDFNTWVLIDESAASTRVNEEKLVSKRAQQKALKSGITIKGNNQVALRSDTPNAIEIGSLNFNIYINGDPAEYQPTPNYNTMPSLELLELRSRPSLSTSMAHSEADLLSLKEQAEYYILTDRVNAWESESKIQKMVHKDTGAVVIGKSYTRLRQATAEALYHRLRDILSAGHQSNLIPFLSETSTLSSYTILAEYWPQSTPLQEFFEIENSLLSSVAELGFMFAQLLEALRFLAENNVIHRDIKPAAILIANRKYYPLILGMTARLSGFSESIVGAKANEIVGHERYRAPEMDGNFYDAKVDVYALSKVVEEYLSLSKGFRPRDPLSDMVTQGLTLDPAQRPSALKLCESFRGLTAGHYGEPFHFFYVRRRFNFACTDSFDDVDIYVRVADVWDVLAVYTGNDPEVAADKLGPFKTAEHGNRFDGSYCRLKKADKMFSKCEIYWASDLLRAEREKLSFEKRSSSWFDLSRLRESRVHYHAPSMMVNISEILQFTGRAGRTVIQDASPPALVQEVRGEARWEGIYINYENFLEISERLGCDSRLGFSVVTKNPKSIKSAALRDRFMEIDSSRFIALVTDRVVPDIMLLSRKDCSVIMRYVRAHDLADEEPVPAKTAIMECRHLGLEDVSTAIQKLMNESRNLEWKCHWLDEEDFPDCSSTTSLSSFSSGAFRFRRRAKGNHKGAKPPISERSKQADQVNNTQSLSLDEDHDDGTDGKINEIEGNPATRELRPNFEDLYSSPRKMNSYNDLAATEGKALPADPHKYDDLSNSSQAMSSRTQFKDRFGGESREIEKAKAVENPNSPFMVERSNRYDEYVESQRSNPKRAAERSRLEPYKSWYQLSPPRQNVESWLQNQTSNDASKNSPRNLQRTSHSSSEEETPKKRRIDGKNTPQNVLHSQGSGETELESSYSDDGEMQKSKTPVGVGIPPKPRSAPKKRSQTARSPRSQTKQTRAEDSMKGDPGHRSK